MLRLGKWFSAGALMVLGAATTMCQGGDAARTRQVRPLMPDAGEGGDATGVTPGTGGSQIGRSGSSSGGTVTGFSGGGPDDDGGQGGQGGEGAMSQGAASGDGGEGGAGSGSGGGSGVSGSGTIGTAGDGGESVGGDAGQSSGAGRGGSGNVGGGGSGNVGGAGSGGTGRSGDGGGSGVGGALAGAGGRGGSGGSGGTVAGGGNAGTSGRSGAGGIAGTGAVSGSGGSVAGGGSGGAGRGGAGSGGTGVSGGGFGGGGTGGVGGIGGAGGARAGSGGGGASGTGGAGRGGSAGGAGTAACTDPGNCCGPSDPACGAEGCPAGVPFCCDRADGVRRSCNPAQVDHDTLCINPCTDRSFGKEACEICTDNQDAPCEDPKWQDACRRGGEAFCSDRKVGYRLGCYGDDALPGGIFTYVACSCDSTALCVPQACCSPGVPLCALDRCEAPAGGSDACCNPTVGYNESCFNFGNSQQTIQDVCINECTEQSYGEGTCQQCLPTADPPCDDQGIWDANCATQVFCSDREAGYRLGCLQSQRTGPKSYYVACTCDPDD